MILGIVLSLAFWPGAFDPASSLRWCVLALAVPFVLATARPRFTMAHLWGAALVAWCALSLTWTAGWLEGVNQLVNLLLLAVAFHWASTIRNPEPVYRGLGIGLAVSSALAIAQWLGWHPVDETDHTPAGLFMLGWVLANTAAPIVVALIGCRQWTLAAAVMPAALLPGARGALVGLGVAAVLFIGVIMRRLHATISLSRRPPLFPPARRVGRRVLLGLWLAAVAAGAAGVAIGASASIGAHNSSGMQRLSIWLDTADALTIPGRGLGAFYASFPQHATRTATTLTRPSHAHNDLLEIAYDTGFVGVVLLAALVIAAARGPLRREHFVLAAVGAETLFIFVLYQPVTAFLAAFALGALARHRPALRHVADGWRIRLQAGLSRGFADC